MHSMHFAAVDDESVEYAQGSDTDRVLYIHCIASVHVVYATNMPFPLQTIFHFTKCYCRKVQFAQIVFFYFIFLE